MKWNPRKMAWTQVRPPPTDLLILPRAPLANPASLLLQLYRRMHKKGADGEKTKARKTRKATGKARGVFGASFDEIKKKRDQSAAARATARAKALRCDAERTRSRCRGRLLVCLPRAPLTPRPLCRSVTRRRRRRTSRSRRAGITRAAASRRTRDQTRRAAWAGKSLAARGK